MSIQSARRREEKARKLELEGKFPELRKGLSYADVGSRIPNADERRQESILMQEREAALLRERNAANTGEAPQDGQSGQPAPPNGQSAFTGVAGRRVGFSSGASASFGGTRPAATGGESFAETDTRKRRESAASGAFGSRAQAKEENLAGRRSLFAEMRAAAGGSSDFRERAKALGIDDAGYARGVARAEGTGVPADRVAGPEPAPTGRALAERNIATMGVQGAAADYFKRKGESQDAVDRSRIAAAPAPTYRSGASPNVPAATPVAPPMSFTGSFARDIDMDGAPEAPDATPLAAASPASEDFGTFKPKPRGRDYNEVAVGKVKGATTKIDETIDTAVRRSVDTVRSGVGGLMSEARRVVGSARDIRGRTNKAGNLMSKNLRKQLGIQ